MGILDFLTGNNAAASPWGALYNSVPAGADPEQARKLAELLAAQNAGSIGGMGVDPNNLGTPPVSPFGDPSKLSVANPSPAPVPASGFGAGASPFGFAGPGSMTGINPAMMTAPAAPQPPAAAPPIAPAPAAAPMNANAQAPAAPSEDDGPDSMVPVGKYQMPMFGEPGDAPQAAAPAGPAAAPGAPSQAAPFSLGGAGGAISDRLMKATRGFMGNMASGPVGALAGGLGALVTGQNTDPTSIASERMNMKGQALLKKGVAPEIVQAALYNPEVMKTLIAQNFGPDKFQHVTKKDAFGGETIGAFDPTTGKTTFEGGGAGGGGNISALPENYDPTTRRDEAFIKALDPVTRQVVEAADRGDNIPQGRNLQKYMPVIQRALQGFQPETYQSRVAFAREMGSGKAGYGLQVKGFQQGLEHMTKLADRMAAQGNWNGLGFPDVAHFANGVREHLSNDQSAASGAVENDAQTLAGEVGKLFSGQAGGGVHERELTRGRFGTRLSGPEGAAALESTLELMNGGLTSIESARDRAYNGNAPAQYNFLGPQQQQQIEHIRQVIQQLKTGQAAPAAAPGGAPALPSGWSVQVR
jgi:hypothetical protein